MEALSALAMKHAIGEARRSGHSEQQMTSRCDWYGSIARNPAPGEDFVMELRSSSKQNSPKAVLCRVKHKATATPSGSQIHAKARIWAKFQAKCL